MLTLCIEDAVRAKFNPADDPFTSIFADIAKACPSVPRPELMAILAKSGVPPKFSNIIRGLMELARYHIKNNEGHNRKWFKMSLGLKEGFLAAPIEFSIYHFFIMKDLKARLMVNQDGKVHVGFSSDDVTTLPLIREHQPAKKVTRTNKMTNTATHVELFLFADDTTSLCRQSYMQQYKEKMKQTFGDWKLTTNDDKWEHITADSDPEKRKARRKTWTKWHACLGRTETPWELPTMIRRIDSWWHEQRGSSYYGNCRAGLCQKNGGTNCDGHGGSDFCLRM